MGSAASFKMSALGVQRGGCSHRAALRLCLPWEGQGGAGVGAALALRQRVRMPVWDTSASDSKWGHGGTSHRGWWRNRDSQGPQSDRRGCGRSPARWRLEALLRRLGVQEQQQAPPALVASLPLRSHHVLVGTSRIHLRRGLGSASRFGQITLQPQASIVFLGAIDRRGSAPRGTCGTM